MSWFLGGILFLIAGYFAYGRFAERVFRPDDRKPPAVDHPDGVDTLPLPQWKWKVYPVPVWKDSPLRP